LSSCSNFSTKIPNNAINIGSDGIERPILIPKLVISIDIGVTKATNKYIKSNEKIKATAKRSKTGSRLNQYHSLAIRKVLMAIYTKLTPEVSNILVLESKNGYILFI